MIDPRAARSLFCEHRQGHDLCPITVRLRNRGRWQDLCSGAAPALGVPRYWQLRAQCHFLGPFLLGGGIELRQAAWR